MSKEHNSVASTGQIQWRPEAVLRLGCHACGTPSVYQNDAKTWPKLYVPGRGGQSVGEVCLNCGGILPKPINYGRPPLHGRSLPALWSRIVHKVRWCWAEAQRRREVRKRQWA